MAWLQFPHRRRGPEPEAVSRSNRPHLPARNDTAPWRPRASSQPVTEPSEGAGPGRSRLRKGVESRRRLGSPPRNTPPRLPLAKRPPQASSHSVFQSPTHPRSVATRPPLELSHPVFRPTGLATPSFPSGRGLSPHQPIRSSGDWQGGAGCPVKRGRKASA